MIIDVICSCGHRITVGNNITYCEKCGAVQYIRRKKVSQDRSYPCDFCNGTGFLYSKRNIYNDSKEFLGSYIYASRCSCRGNDKLKLYLSELQGLKKVMKDNSPDPIKERELSNKIKSLEFELYGNVSHINKIRFYDESTGMRFPDLVYKVDESREFTGNSDRGFNSCLFYRDILKDCKDCEVKNEVIESIVEESTTEEIGYTY
jgi:hypothetical protein